MEILNAIILGSVQGLTEFIPISSSGHLILAREILGITPNINDLGFDAILQLATTLAVLIYFFKDFISLWKNRKDKKEKVLLWAIIVGTIPAVVLGLLLEDYMETVFRHSGIIIWTLIGGAAIMYLAEILSKQNKELSARNGFIIGIFQSLALIPGMSRSGMTISGGLFMGLSREKATRFSFMLALPVLLGSGFKKILDLGASGVLSSLGTELIIGSIFAFIVGLAAIHFLITYLKNNTLKVFVWYRLVLAAVLLFVF
jgi:undecaprenyl-diphosphatase